MKKAINIQISIGELIDKITILEIKSKRIDSQEKRKLILSELKLLSKKEDNIEFSGNNEKVKYLKLKKKLYNTNLDLWKIEDGLREMESLKKFTDDFISLARNVYLLNDKRAKIKNDINELLNSKIKDIKHYKNYL